VLTSFLKSTKDVNPWPHYVIKNIFDDCICKWICEYPYPSNEEIEACAPNYQMLPRNNGDLITYLKKAKQIASELTDYRWFKKIHSCEIIFNERLISESIYAKMIVDNFCDSKLIEYLEQTSGKNFKKSYVRIQLLKDLTGCHIGLHTDMETKLFTLICFFCTEKNSDIGTQLYDGETFVKRIPYEENSGAFFFPAQKGNKDVKPTFHAFMNTPFVDSRISMIVNYFDESELTLDIVGKNLGHYIPIQR
jgi:hypothetical protein